jgi:divalent metal cation (Fe/Co/Zn/Cd) transporter
MRSVERIEFPPEQAEAFRKARRLEWITVAFISSAALLLYLTMGSSQAMRTSWLEDMISLVPPIAFLVCSRLATRKATVGLPYGMHSSVSIGYLTASLALLAMGCFLLAEAAVKLSSGERTSIGGYTLLGTTFWAGWLMLLALAYTGVPSFFLGRAKLRLAPTIHDKILYADAEMMRADWMVEVATAVGVIATGFGLWWMDAVAASVVSLDILRDGARNTLAAVADLIDEAPRRTIDRNELEPLPGELARYAESLDWVEKAEVRMREEGHVFFGEIFVVPRSTCEMSAEELAARIGDLARKAKAFNWRVHDVTVMPIERSRMEAELGASTDVQ